MYNNPPGIGKIFENHYFSSVTIQGDRFNDPRPRINPVEYSTDPVNG